MSSITRTRYGRYQTLFRIAGGGMAEVWAARVVGEGGFQKLVALKRMLPTLAQDDRFVSMFLDEGRIAAAISSPHVVQTLDLGRAKDDSLFLVMELVVGISLRGLLAALGDAGERIPQEIAVALLAQTASGLHDAHEATTATGEPLAIIHRDISPHNVLIGVDGRARITDFGIARALQRHTETVSGEVKGKLAYFAPEQALGRDLDRRVDLFALGIVAWETLTQQRLFLAETPVHVLQKILKDPITPPHEVCDDIPEAVSRVVMTALERNPEKRFATAKAMSDALRNSGVRAASQERLGQYIHDHGGTALRRIEDGIKNALAESDPPPAGEEVSEVSVPSFGPAAIDRLAPRLESSTEPKRRRDRRDPSESQVTRTLEPGEGGTRTGFTFTTTLPLKSVWRPVVAAGIVAVAIFVGAWLAVSGDPDVPVRAHEERSGELPPPVAQPAQDTLGDDPGRDSPLAGLTKTAPEEQADDPPDEAPEVARPAPPDRTRLQKRPPVTHMETVAVTMETAMETAVASPMAPPPMESGMQSMPMGLLPPDF